MISVDRRAQKLPEPVRQGLGRRRGCAGAGRSVVCARPAARAASRSAPRRWRPATPARPRASPASSRASSPAWPRGAPRRRAALLRRRQVAVALDRRVAPGGLSLFLRHGFFFFGYQMLSESLVLGRAPARQLLSRDTSVFVPALELAMLALPMHSLRRGVCAAVPSWSQLRRSC